MFEIEFTIAKDLTFVIQMCITFQKCNEIIYSFGLDLAAVLHTYVLCKPYFIQLFLLFQYVHRNNIICYVYFYGSVMTAAGYSKPIRLKI